MNVYLYIRNNAEKAAALIKAKLAECKISVVDNIDSADIGIAVGGDGTLLRLAGKAMEKDIPVLGINAGRVGFLTCLELSEIDGPAGLGGLSRLLTGEYRTTNRSLLSLELNGESYTALNDIVFSKDTTAPLVDFLLRRELTEENPIHFRSDGLIFATPTGSTGYALSAGGPVIDPSLAGVLVTPICPHSLSARSVIFSDDKAFWLSADETPVNVFADGQHIGKLNGGGTAQIKKSAKTVKLIDFGRDFYRVIREKLI